MKIIDVKDDLIARLLRPVREALWVTGRLDAPLFNRLAPCSVTCNQSWRAVTDMAANPKSSRLKVRAHRARLRKLGLRPIRIWMPDMRAPAFRAAARRQSKVVAVSAKARADQRFINAVSDWSEARRYKQREKNTRTVR